MRPFPAFDNRSLVESRHGTPETRRMSAAATDLPSRQDLIELTKARLSIMVVITTAAGFLSAWPAGARFDFWLLFHTILGTLLSAFGAAAINQVMEMRADQKMARTANRPLAAGRLPPAAGVAIGAVLAAFGVAHLGVKVNNAAAMLSLATLAVYVLAYTPLKRRSSWNTIVGAVSGAIPPVIGWVGAGGDFNAGAAWWFALLFFWQLPHFFAINWMYREEYRKAGFVMLANNDDDGKKTSRWALAFAVVLLALAVCAPFCEVSRWWFVVPGLLLAGWLVWLGLKFVGTPERTTARKLFFATLIYLPVVLVAVLAAKPG